MYFDVFYCKDNDDDDEDEDDDDDEDDEDDDDDEEDEDDGACEMRHLSNKKGPSKLFCPTSTALAAALQSSATGVLDLHPG